MTTSRAAYYVLMISTGTPVPLNTEAKTLADARRSIRWQIRGGFEPAHYVLTRYDARANVFREAYGPRVFACTDRGFYTEAAFAQFLADLPRAA